MKIKVHMLAFEDKEVIRQVKLPGEHCADMKDNDLLDLVFHYGQNDFAIGPEKNKSCSVSVGDVVELPDGRLFLVMGFGFKQINANQLDYIRKLPMRERQFNDLVRR